ncbi:MAG: hypothetical protein Q8T09_00170 [Candidatus Melainabacteria bacterium]|nr:hypothetical protein [Candidatus Melainabacteria bacterium]
MMQPIQHQPVYRGHEANGRVYKVSSQGIIPPVSDHFTIDNILDFDGRVIYFNTDGGSQWFYGIVHFHGERTFVNLAVDFSRDKAGLHVVLYPYHAKVRETFIFRLAFSEEYQGLVFSNDDFCTT